MHYLNITGSHYNFMYTVCRVNYFEYMDILDTVMVF